jgi:outer membrane protein
MIYTKSLRRLSEWRLAACALLIAVCPSHSAFAETLAEALADAYLYNPRLNAERANLRATDEGVASAKSGFRPQISGSVDGGLRWSESNSPGAVNFNPLPGVGGAGAGVGGGFGGDQGTTYPFSYGVGVNQNIFQGFQNLNAVRGAKAQVQAGRENLRTVERDVLLQAATVYVDVVRDQAVVVLRENDVRVLTEQLKATRDRFDVGEVTRTDVAQAEARRSEALATLATAQANLKSTRATYQQVIGHPPGRLQTPPSILHLLPRDLNEALTIADGENPSILSAVYSEEASLYAIQEAMGQLLPTISLSGNYDKFYAGAGDGRATQSASLFGSLSVPLYQGGGPSAAVRRAKETNTAAKRAVEDARLSVHANTLSQWGILQSSGPAIQAAEAAVSANKIALTGVREEEKVGQRTTLDVLDAQRELLNTQINLVSALRDRIVAEYSLYAAIGRMDAQTLGLSVPYYDPFEHYEIVKNKLWGLAPPEPPLADN